MAPVLKKNIQYNVIGMLFVSFELALVGSCLCSQLNGIVDPALNLLQEYSKTNNIILNFIHIPSLDYNNKQQFA